MPAQQPEPEQKPSFVRSVMSGIGGYIKGAITGGAVGAIGGAAIAALIAVATALTGPGLLVAGAGAAIAETAIGGAAIGGILLASVGAIAGAMTGVIKSREAGQPSADDVVNVAKIAFAQGVAVGHNIEHAAHHGQNKFQEKLATDRASPITMAERQIVN